MDLKNVNFKKSLGQNFLIDKNIVDKIINSAQIDKETLVIEIGPGSGALSKSIASLCGNLICYEIDKSLKTILDEKLADFNNVLVKYEDFLNADVLKDIKDYSYKKLIVVANLPYYVTTPIINKLIIDNIMPSLMVLMVQKEVADRFCAKKSSKNYNSLSVFLQYHYDINPLFIVSNNCFIPKPKVDSCVVRFKLKDEKLPVNDINKFYKLIRDSFRFKRKNLKNNLSSYDLDKVNLILSKYGFDLTARAEELDLNIFVDIANNI